MYCKLDSTTAGDLALALIARMAEGTGDTTVMIYTGTPPAGPATAPGGTLLGTLVCAATPATNSGGVVTFNTITQDSAADADGTAAWARITNGDGDGVIDIDVSNAGGSGALKLNTVTIVAGGPILISSLVITIGG